MAFMDDYSGKDDDDDDDYHFSAAAAAACALRNWPRPSSRQVDRRTYVRSMHRLAGGRAARR